MPEPSHQDRRTLRPLALIIALVVMALLLTLVALRQQPPAPRGVDAPSDQFSAGRVQALLQEILAEATPHGAGSEQNDRVRQRIVSALEGLGYEVEIQETMACRGTAGAHTTCAQVKNIVTRLPGREAGPSLMLAAHYDSVPAGPGVADDGHAVASILEMARILKERGPYRNSILFLITDAEELGLLGAKGFIDDHPSAEEVAVVLNMEARGTSGQSFMFETSEGNQWLIDAYASAVPRPASSSLHYEIYRILPNDTDLTMFRAGGMAGLNFAFIDRASHYHTPLDSFENLDLGSVQHQGDNVLAVAQELAGVDLSNPPPGNAAWTDLLGFATVYWPASWTVPLAVLALLLHVAAAFSLVRRRALTVGGLLLGLLAAFLCVLAAVLLGLVLTWLVSQVTGVPSPWYAYPLPMRLSVWAAALLSGGLAATAVARRSGAWGLAMGAWLLWAALALVLGIVLTGTAIMLLLPALVAGVLFAVIAFSRLSESAPAREVAFLSAALGAGVIWLSLSLAFESAVSFDLSPAITLGLGLVVSTLAPFFALPQDRTRVRRWLLIGTAVTVVLATFVAMVVPTYSVSAPQQVNLYHFEDRDGGTAYWAAAGKQGVVSEPLRAQFDAEPAAVFPWTEEPFPVASTNPTTVPAPDLRVVSDDLVSGERVIEAQLRLPEEADWIHLHLPVDRVHSVTVGDSTFPVSPDGAWNGYYTLECHGRACDGWMVKLHLEDADPVEVLVVGFSYGLPAGGEALIQARPDTVVPAHEGDLTIIMKRLEL